MTFDDLKNDWSSPHNNLSPGQQQTLTETFTRQMIRRRRFQGLWLINTFVWLTVITILAIRTIAVGNVNLAQEWILLPLLIVPWGFAVHFLRRYLKPMVPMTHGELSIIDSLRSALASNRETQTHLKLVGVLFAIMIPLLAFAIHRLYTVGKVSERELASMVLFFGVILLLCGSGVAARYFRRLLPQQKRLDALLIELVDEPR